MRTSAVHAAILAAVALFRAEAALSTVDVIDGPPFEWNPLRVPEQRGDGRRYLFVGATPDGDDGDAATGSQAFGGTGGAARSRDERFAITSTALVLDGGQDAPAVRAELFSLLSVVETVLLSHVDLSGAVLYSEFGGVEKLKQFYGDHGLTVSAQFDIACRAYLTS